MRLSFTSQIVVGLLLGIAWGLFFGDMGAWVHWVGDAYVGLLQMTVLPYVAVSLTSSIGRLSPDQGGRVARVATGVLLLLWLIGLLSLALMTFSFPQWKAGSFFSTSLVEDLPSPDWLELFIPSNPFRSLTYGLVPAVVLFSVGLGAALIRTANKELLLDKLDVLVEGLSRLNRMVLRCAPWGIFGIAGHAAATTSLQQFGLLQGYLLAYGAAALLLTLWVLPALIATCTPYKQREVLSASRDVLITAFIIGNTFVVLPMLIDAIKRLISQTTQTSANAVQTPEYAVQLAYPFPDIGRIVGLIFVPFAAWFYGATIDVGDYTKLAGAGVLSSFAKPVVAMPLLLNLAEIPADIFNLFLACGVVASRFGDVMKVMHLIAFTLIASSILSGTARLHLGRMVMRATITAVLFAAAVFSLRSLFIFSFAENYERDDLIVARPLLGKPANAVIVGASTPNPVPLAEQEDRLGRIKRRGVIRIGIDSTRLPFSYRNRKGELVGFDIDMAHQMAHDLGVDIEFVPLTAGRVVEQLKADHYDVAMAALEGTIERAAQLPEMHPYLEVTRAVVTPDHRRREFRSLKELAANLHDSRPLRVGVVPGSLAAEIRSPDSKLGKAWGAVQDAGLAELIETVELESALEFFQSDPPVADVWVTSAEEGSAWTLEHPEFTVVKPEDFDARTPLYYLVAERSGLRDFINSWLKLKRRNGVIQQLYDYWILGIDQRNATPRWSIIRDVLHWTD